MKHKFKIQFKIIEHYGDGNVRINVDCYEHEAILFGLVKFWTQIEGYVLNTFIIKRCDINGDKIITRTDISLPTSKEISFDTYKQMQTYLTEELKLKPQDSYYITINSMEY